MLASFKLQRIEGFDSLLALRKLYLYSNHINKIENLEHLTHLELLWLNDNNITVIEVEKDEGWIECKSYRATILPRL